MFPHVHWRLIIFYFYITMRNRCLLLFSISRIFLLANPSFKCCWTKFRNLDFLQTTLLIILTKYWLNYEGNECYFLVSTYRSESSASTLLSISVIRIIKRFEFFTDNVNIFLIETVTYQDLGLQGEGFKIYSKFSLVIRMWGRVKK